MKKFIKLNIIAIVLLSSYTVLSQQLPQFTQYMYNTISVNPAYAGSRETISLVGLHRSQWASLDGAPTTQTFSIHSPMRNEKVGLGLSFINDKLGFENFTYIYGDFSYTLNLNEKTKLAFGLKGGFTSYSIDQELRNRYPDDDAILGIESRWNPNIGIGAYLHQNKWYLGLSAPRVLTTDLNKNNDIKALERISYYFTGGYVFTMNETTKFKPAFLVKATNGAPLSYDLTANFLFHDKFWLGAGYRINEATSSLGILTDFQVSQQLRIGYAYEYPFSDINRFSGGTHEILLMFEVFKSKRVKSPRFF